MQLADLDPRAVLRQILLGIAANDGIRDLIEKAPVSREVVHRYVPGAGMGTVVDAASALAETGRKSTIDYLGEDTSDLDHARATRDQYLHLLQQLSDAGLTQDAQVEVSVKLSAIGQALPGDGQKIALEHARDICRAAANVGTTVTLDMEDHTTTDLTLEILRELRLDFPWVGAVLQAYLFRTEADCRDLAYEGSRVRLCKGSYREPESVAYQTYTDIGTSYVRCLKILMAGEGYPMVASHDPRLVSIAAALVKKYDRVPGTYEYQMLYGIRREEQRAISDRGDQMRVYIPYGEEWYGYLMRRMAEKPSSLFLFLRSLVSKG